MDRRITLRASHAVGVALLLAIVVPALVGVFDTKTTELRESIGRAEVVVTYPTRLRVKTGGVLEVRLHGTATDSLRLTIDDAYLASFDSFGYADYLPRIVARPAVWRFEFEAARIGRATGRLDVAVGADSASFDLHTHILP